MIRTIFAAFILLACCGGEKEKKEDQTNTLKALQEKREVYLKLVGSPENLMEDLHCDALTFMGIWNSSVPKKNRIDIYRFEKSKGDWVRSYLYDCQGLSAENVMGALHGLLTEGDRGSIKDIIDFGWKHFWKWPNGNNLIHLMPITYLAAGKDVPGFKTKWDDPWDIVEDKIKSYRGNVIMDYIWLYSRIKGEIRSWHFEVIKEFKKVVPESPIYEAMHACYSDGDQSKAIDMLSTSEFPKDKLPKGSLEHVFEWSSVNPVILYMMTLKIIEQCQ